MRGKLVGTGVLAIALIAGNSFAMGGGMMGGGMMAGPGSGWNGGIVPPGPLAGTPMHGTVDGDWRCAGPGYGAAGAGRLKSGMLGWTARGGYLDILSPVATPEDADAAVANFLSSASSTLQVAELWEYQGAYKAELADSTGQKAFDVVVDKLTGSVLPEMGMAMMMNATWGKQLQQTPKFPRKLVLTPEDAVAAAEAFLAKNAAVIGYTLAAPEVYPGHYKFHTTDAATGKPGVDIVVNGYTGGISMNTLMGAPVAQVR